MVSRGLRGSDRSHDDSGGTEDKGADNVDKDAFQHGDSGDLRSPPRWRHVFVARHRRKVHVGKLAAADNEIMLAERGIALGGTIGILHTRRKMQQIYQCLRNMRLPALLSGVASKQ